ncbi:hypothetical protein ACS0TY_020483 [Phlomoides rotata]
MMKQCADTEGTTQLDKTIPTREQQRKRIKRVERGRYQRHETLTRNWDISGFGFEEAGQ